MLTTLQLDSITTEIRQHPIIRHPFLMALRSGVFTRDQLRLWITQQYFFSSQFPRCLAALYARIEDPFASRPLMRFLSVEHWGSQATGAHWQQYVAVLDWFGLSLTDLNSRAALPETVEYLSYRLDLCLTAPIEEALGAIGFGHELVNCDIFEAYLRGVEQLPDVPTHALKYFESHVADEPEDFEIFARLIIAVATSPDQLESVRRGALRVLDARMTFFDRIHERVGMHIS